VQKEQCVRYIRDTFKKASRARACRLMGQARSGMYYVKKMPAKDKSLKDVIIAAIGSRRIGREKVTVLVQRMDPTIGSSKIRRVYQNEGLSLRSRMRKRRFKQVANPIEMTFAKNEEWAMDFMSDSLSNGRRFRTLNIVDHYNRECLGIDVRHSIPALKVISYLEIMIDTHGKPKRIRTDNGPEFTSKRLQTWLDEKKIKWNPIQNGKPQQNAIVERFNRTFREDILDSQIFDSIDNAQAISQEWLEDYNRVRPHQALKNQTPLEYAM
jgi:putative transposase